MKRVFLFCAAVCVMLVCFGCGSITGRNTSNLSPEAQFMAENYQLEEVVQHESLDELLENCSDENIKAAYGAFPSDSFEQVSYFNAFYKWDEDRTAPLSIVMFDYSGDTYYFAGSKHSNPFVPGFSSYTKFEIYSAKDRASSKVVSGGEVQAGDITYYGHDADFALTLIDESVELSTYLDVLAEIVGGEFKCVMRDYVSIEDSTIYINYRFDDVCSEVTYTLSNPDVLSEVSFSYEMGSDPEIVNYSDDPDAPGSDMIMNPNKVDITFEAVGDGQTVLDIYDDNGETIYSVTIEADGDFAFLP